MHASPPRASLLVPLALIAPAVLAAPAAADPAADAALIQAVYNGDLRAMQEALRAGASFNARDENGYTPLHWAAFRGYGVLAGYMLDRGATTDVPDQNGYTPLMLAAFNGHDTVVRLLLARGASRERRSQDGFTAWDYAKGQGHAALLPLLRPASGASAAAPRPGGPVTSARGPAASSGREGPSTWPSARPTPQPRPSEPSGEPTPASEPQPEWLVMPTASPAATPAPVPSQGSSPAPAPATPAGPANAFEAVAGMHLSRLSFPIAGIHYRRSLHDWFSLRLGAEYGRTQASKTGALELGFTRLNAALLTNGWFYVGGGATHITLGTLYAGGYNPSALSWDAIAGLRGGLGPLTATGEFRFGVGGPSTATGGLGLRF